jgi:hypothetical protein
VTYSFRISVVDFSDNTLLWVSLYSLLLVRVKHYHKLWGPFICVATVVYDGVDQLLSPQPSRPAECTALQKQRTTVQKQSTINDQTTQLRNLETLAPSCASTWHLAWHPSARLVVPLNTKRQHDLNRASNSDWLARANWLPASQRCSNRLDLSLD